jgi:acyl dehydratase
VTADYLVLDAIGREGEPHLYHVREEALRAYAEATGGRTAGPVFAIVPAWETIPAASRLVASDDDTRRRILHAAQDIHLHAPIEAGMSLVTTAAPIGVFARRSGTALVIRAETRADEKLVAEQYVTELFRGLEAPADRGRPGPDVPEVSRAGDPHETTIAIAPDQAERYAHASGDRNPIHLDDEAARAVGLPGRILHGLCTLALAGRAVTDAAGREPTRLAVRFSAPVELGEALTTRVWRSDGGFAFETATNCATVLKGGWAEGA